MKARPEWNAKKQYIFYLKLYSQKQGKEKMLVLERKEGESIIIKNNDDVIEIILARDQHGRVKIGIDAPEKFNIVRKELIE